MEGLWCGLQKNKQEAGLGWGGVKENLRKGCTGKINAAHKGEGSDGDMSFGQAMPNLAAL